MTPEHANREQFRIWRAAVVRLAIRDRWKADVEAAKQRIIARAIARGTS